jgi:hydrogenase maturation protease
VAEQSTSSGHQVSQDRGRRLLVVGCGNPLAGDDSAGPEAVSRLEGLKAGDILLHTAPFISLDLFEIFPPTDAILFVDAVSSDAAPGTLHLVPLAEVPLEARGLTSLSGHGWGLAETLKLAQALRRGLPPSLLLGVEVGIVKQGAPRSPAVEQAVSLIVERFDLLRSLVLNPESGVWQEARQFAPGDLSFPGP